MCGDPGRWWGGRRTSLWGLELCDHKLRSTKCCVCVLSCVSLLVTPWTVAHQAPLSLEFSRQEHKSGLPFPTPKDLLDPGIKPKSLASPAWAGGFFTPMPPEKPKNTQDSGKSTIETAVYEILQEITQREPTRSTHWLQASKPSEFWATCFGGLATQFVVLCHKSLGALAGPHWRENLSPTQLAKVCDHQKPLIWKHLCLARALKPLWPRDTDRKCRLSWCL